MSLSVRCSKLTLAPQSDDSFTPAQTCGTYFSVSVTVVVDTVVVSVMVLSVTVEPVAEVVVAVVVVPVTVSCKSAPEF